MSPSVRFVSLLILASACEKAPPAVPPTTASGPVSGAAVAPTAPAPAPPSEPAPPPGLATRPADAVALGPGLSFRKERSGTSDSRPDPADQVRWRHVTWRPDGTTVESTFTRIEAPQEPLAGMGAAFREALLRLAPAERALVWVDAGAGGAGSPAVVHLVELVGIVPGKRLPRLDGLSPEPPAEARRAGPGLTCTTLQAPTGQRPPGPKDTLRHGIDCYTADGAYFEGMARGDGPSEAPLSAMTPAGRAAFGKMRAGESRRCWVEAGVDLGLGRAGAPPLICDLSLFGTRQNP